MKFVIIFLMIFQILIYRNLLMYGLETRLNMAEENFVMAEERCGCMREVSLFLI